MSNLILILVILIILIIVAIAITFQKSAQNVTELMKYSILRSKLTFDWMLAPDNQKEAILKQLYENQVKLGKAYKPLVGGSSDEFTKSLLKKIDEDVEIYNNLCRANGREIVETINDLADLEKLDDQQVSIISTNLDNPAFKTDYIRQKMYDFDRTTVKGAQLITSGAPREEIQKVAKLNLNIVQDIARYFDSLIV